MSSRPLVKDHSVPAGAVFINANQLRARWGGVSHMFIDRKVASDPAFPKPGQFGNGRLRLFRLAEVEAYERESAVRRGD